MDFTKEQKNYLAEVYANGKSSSSVFKEQHKIDFIAGFEKALSLFYIATNKDQCVHENKIWTIDPWDQKCYKCVLCGKYNV